MTNSFDTGIICFLNGFSHRSWLFDRVVVLLEVNTLLKGGLAMTVFWWLWWRRKPSDEERRILLFGLLASFAGLLLARSLALLLPFRQRPLRNPLLHFQIPYTLDPKTLIGWSSFPSDHATLFFSLAVTFLFVSQALGIVAFVYAFVVVCLPRLYLGIHYPTDILAGVLLGIGVGSLGSLQRLRRIVTDPLLKWSETSPASFYAFLFLCSFSVAQQFDAVRDMGKLAFELAKFTVSR